MAFPFVASGTGTDAELLALVREAISVVLGDAQEYELRGRRYTRADLAQLWQMENELQTRVARSTSGLSKNYVKLRRPR